MTKYVLEEGEKLEIKLEKNEACIVRFKSFLWYEQIIEFTSLLKLGEIDVKRLSLNGFYDQVVKV